MAQKDLIKVPNKAALNALVQHEKGEIAFCEEDKTYYVYSGTEWTEMPVEQSDDGQLTIDLYSLNKQIISQLPPFDEQRTKDARETLDNWKKDNIPYLLYGKEIGYFSLLYPTDDETESNFIDAVFECLDHITEKIYSFDVVSEDAIEIWIDYKDEATALYLFDYSDGMVYYNA